MINTDIFRGINLCNLQKFSVFKPRCFTKKNCVHLLNLWYNKYSVVKF